MSLAYAILQRSSLPTISQRENPRPNLLDIQRWCASGLASRGVHHGDVQLRCAENLDDPQGQRTFASRRSAQQELLQVAAVIHRCRMRGQTNSLSLRNLAETGRPPGRYPGQHQRDYARDHWDFHVTGVVNVDLG